MDELCGEDVEDDGLVVVVVGEVQVERVCAEVRVFVRVYSRKAMMLDKHLAMCR